MKIGFSTDQNGVILVAYYPESLKTAVATTAYVPQPGESHYITDLPKELEGKSLGEIASSHRVNLSGAKPVFESLASK